MQTRAYRPASGGERTFQIIWGGRSRVGAWREVAGEFIVTSAYGEARELRRARGPRVLAERMLARLVSDHVQRNGEPA